MGKILKTSLLTVVSIASLISMGPVMGYAQSQSACTSNTNQETAIRSDNISKIKQEKNMFDVFKSWFMREKTNSSTNLKDENSSECNLNSDSEHTAACENGENCNLAEHEHTAECENGENCNLVEHSHSAECENGENCNLTTDGNTSVSNNDSTNGNVADSTNKLDDVDKAGYDAYYTNVKKTSKGIIVMGSAKVNASTLDVAGSIIDNMLSKEGTGIVEKMVQNKSKLAIFGKGENVFSIPEHKQFYSESLLYAEGLGGTMSVPVSSISEANVLRLTSGDYVTAYKDESILVHEFAHAIQLVGVDQLDDKSLYNEFNEAYNNAKANNLFPNTYAISNREEFFATTTQIWFNVMNESSDGSWDGTRGPVNTREELKAYDKKTYDFLAKIYPENVVLSEAWSSGIANKFSAK